jgi:hypothetical protein
VLESTGYWHEMTLMRRLSIATLDCCLQHSEATEFSEARHATIDPTIEHASDQNDVM